MAATTPKKWLTCAETAKMVRQVLKARWPHVKFSVRSNTYAGGSSIDVRWLDGPMVSEVEAAVAHLEGASFDGMIDLKSYNEPMMIDGVPVMSGADFIMEARGYSEGMLRRLVDKVARRYGVNLGEIKIRVWNDGSAYLDHDPYIQEAGEWLATLTYREGARTRQAVGA